jgi:hypothetical protein
MSFDEQSASTNKRSLAVKIKKIEKNSYEKNFPRMLFLAELLFAIDAQQDNCSSL